MLSGTSSAAVSATTDTRRDRPRRTGAVLDRSASDCRSSARGSGRFALSRASKSECSSPLKNPLTRSLLCRCSSCDFLHRIPRTGGKPYAPAKKISASRADEAELTQDRDVRLARVEPRRLLVRLAPGAAVARVAEVVPDAPVVGTQREGTAQVSPRRRLVVECELRLREPLQRFS